MQALHLVLLAISAVAFVAAATSGTRLGSGSEHGRLITAVVSGAAIVGNAASLLPGTATWYGHFMVVATVGVTAWVIAELVRRTWPGRAERSEQPEVVRVVRTVPVQRAATMVRPATTQRSTRPAQPGAFAQPESVTQSAPFEQPAAQARPNLYVMPDTDIIDAEIVEEAASLAAAPTSATPTSATPTTAWARPTTQPDTTGSGPRDPGPRLVVATQETFAEYGPAAARGLNGPHYVAANLRDYQPQTEADRASARRRATRRHPSDEDLRARLTRTYGQAVERRGTFASYQA
ncbi:hypothetical protein BJY21_001797 [Kineosphaera limosa]|uniref:Uncharacterized protein n=1 Tax=Kineosphaera limosa NBRC 100340 TaxID=1184609 RepID=K6VMS9_9MICO|nr:hypothetical protein [Kineosphaera limosa]NYE00613.1 hypothetical protein [Kineosphaera limosa]GAB97533.1 hypothetical protein KILIM_073_00130 [Kineosphaera limosa NBRC 100340]